MIMHQFHRDQRSIVLLRTLSLSLNSVLSSRVLSPFQQCKKQAPHDRSMHNLRMIMRASKMKSDVNRRRMSIPYSTAPLLLLVPYVLLVLLTSSLATITSLTSADFVPTLLNPIPTPPLNGTITLYVVCAPEDEMYTRPALDRFELMYPGVKATLVDFPHSSTDRLTYFQTAYFQKRSTEIDLAAIDVVYPGVLGEYLLDLNQYNMAPLAEQFNPPAVQNNMVNGKLVALPLHTDFGILYYRTDLLAKYNYTSPPKTWQELGNMSRVIVTGEQAHGNFILQGYTFQGAAYEGLTCDALEWIHSYGGGKIVETDANGVERITINNPNAIDAIDTIASFVGTSVTPITTVNAMETQSDATFANGNAVFLRSWPNLYHDLIGTQVEGKFNGTYLPSNNATKQGSSALGGWNWSINKYSLHPEWSILLMSFLLSPSELFFRGSNGKIPAALPGVIPNASQMCNSSIPSFCNLPSPTLAARPSTLTGSKYGEVSQLFYRGVNDVFIGRSNATKFVAELECDLSTLLGIRVDRCMEGIAMPYVQSDATINTFTAISVILLILTLLLTIATYIYRDHQVMKAATPIFLGLMLLGCMLGYASVITLIQYEPTQAICELQACLAHIGFTLIFGSLFLKTYRLHVIFNATKLDIIHISDMQLLIKQVILLAATGVYLAIWLGVDPPTPTITQILNTSYLVCHSSDSYWPNLILIVEGLSVAYGVYLCLAVRSIPSLFNESNYVAISIYNLAVLGTIILLITKVALTVYDKAVLFECSAVLVVLIVTTVLMVGSKFVMIYRGHSILPAFVETSMGESSSLHSNRAKSHQTLAPAGAGAGGHHPNKQSMSMMKGNSGGVIAPAPSLAHPATAGPSHRRNFSSLGRHPLPRHSPAAVEMTKTSANAASSTMIGAVRTSDATEPTNQSPTNSPLVGATNDPFNLLLVASLREEIAELKRLLLLQTHSQQHQGHQLAEKEQEHQEHHHLLYYADIHSADSSPQLQPEVHPEPASVTSGNDDSPSHILPRTESHEIEVTVHAVGPIESTEEMNGEPAAAAEEEREE